MPRARSDKGKGVASGPSRGYISEIESDEEERQRQFLEQFEPPVQPKGRQRKTEAQKQAEKEAAEEEWKEGMWKRRIKNERQVLRDTFGNNHPGVQAIVRQGMQYWFEPLPLFNKRMVIQFYGNMRTEPWNIQSRPAVHHKIVTKVGSQVITVTPDVVAKFMNYREPCRLDITYTPTSRVDPALVARALYANIGEFKGTHKPGFFREEYRLINKAVHANIYPRGSDSRPSTKGAEVVYAFCHPSTVCNWAEFIYAQILDFQNEVSPKAKMPFPCLITSICREYKVRGPFHDTVEILKPGPIDLHQMNKSKAASSRSAAYVQELSHLTTRPPPRAKMDTWFEKLFCQNVFQIRCLRKLKKESRIAKKERRAMQNELAWQRGVLESQGAASYEPAPVVLTSESEAEEGEAVEEEIAEEEESEGED